MATIYSEYQENVAGPSVTVPVPRYATKHTLSCEGASGTVTVTFSSPGITTPQNAENNTIDLSAPAPIFIQGQFDEITLTLSGGSNFTYSLLGDA